MNVSARVVVTCATQTCAPIETSIDKEPAFIAICADSAARKRQLDAVIERVVSKTTLRASTNRVKAPKTNPNEVATTGVLPAPNAAHIQA